MNKKTKISLKFLSLLSLIAKVIFAFNAAMFVFVGVVIAIPPFRDQVKTNATIGGKNIQIDGSLVNMGVIFGSLILGLIFVLILFSIANLLKSLVNNMQQEQFFTANNLHYLKQILTNIWELIFVQGIFIIADLGINIDSHGNDFNLNLTSLVITLVFLAIFYTIYTLVKNGTELKDENDSFL